MTRESFRQYSLTFCSIYATISILFVLLVSHLKSHSVANPCRFLRFYKNRINELDMSISDLARRSGVSRATVIRILGGKDERYSVSNLQAVLSALGMKMDLLAIPAKGFKNSIATQKAKRLIALTQGNVALESQAVSAASAQEHLEATKARIASSSRKLWAS